MGVATRAPQHLFEVLASRTKEVFFAYQPATARFTYLSPAFAALWRTSPENVMNRPDCLLETVHPEDREHVQHLYREATAGREIHNAEFRIVPAGPHPRWVCLSVYRQEDAHGITLAGIAQDITDRKDHEQTAHKFTAKKNALLEILSHDLSTPLVNIQGLAHLLKLHLSYQEQHQLQQTIDLLGEVARRNVHLIRTFVQQEALEEAKVELYRERTDVVEKISHAIGQLKGSEGALGKTFHLSGSSPAVYLEVDQVKFIQVVGQLLSNTIKFTPDGGTVTTRVEEQERSVLITVADTGIGIPPPLQPLVFHPFSRAKRAGLRGEESTGLGLSIVRAIVELHGGKVWLHSEEGRGTTFFVELPKAGSLAD
jgi:two-component system sensor histidine kinase VicK